MNRCLSAAPRILFLIACAIMIFTPLAQAAGSVQNPAHLIVDDPPYVRAEWSASPGTTAAVTESTWVVSVNCTTGQAISGPLGLAQLIESGNAGSRTMRSFRVQAIHGDCLVPAGNILQNSNGAVLASSVGPKYGPF